MRACDLGNRGALLMSHLRLEMPRPDMMPDIVDRIEPLAAVRSDEMEHARQKLEFAISCPEALSNMVQVVADILQQMSLTS